MESGCVVYNILNRKGSLLKCLVMVFLSRVDLLFLIILCSEMIFLVVFCICELFFGCVFIYSLVIGWLDGFFIL